LFLKRKSAIQTEAEGLGEQSQKTADATSQAKVQAAIADAEANAPSTLAGVESRLESGSF
jgi:hypothetical protein